MAHHALEDAKALFALLVHVLDEKDIHEELKRTKDKKKKKKSKPHPSSDLYDVKGVGVKSVAVFHKQGIKTKEQLYNMVFKMDFNTWCKTFSEVHQYKKLYERLGEVYKDTAVV